MPQRLTTFQEIKNPAPCLHRAAPACALTCLTQQRIYMLLCVGQDLLDWHVGHWKQVRQHFLQRQRTNLQRYEHRLAILLQASATAQEGPGSSLAVPPVSPAQLAS